VTNSDQRDTVFARIREALRRPAPHRIAGHVHYDMTDSANAEAGQQPLPESDVFRTWLPVVGPTLNDQVALFAQNSVGLKTDFREVASPEEAVQQLTALAGEEKWQRIASHSHPLAATIAQKLGLPCLMTESGYSPAELEQCDASISGCDCLVAQTGSVLVTPQSAGGRTLSVLPPHHIVVARRDQMVPDLTTALQLVRKTYAPNWPSMISFITGPSRTGDIERILVLGAHGPKKLTVLLLP
jgi:L-lactate dehydrogenase complex protein LldG